MLKQTQPLPSQFPPALPLELAPEPAGRPFTARRPRHKRRLTTAVQLIGGCLALSGQAACGGPAEFELTSSFGNQTVGTTGGALTTLLPTPAPFLLDVKQQAVAHNAKGPVTVVEMSGLVFQTTVGGSTDGSSVGFGFVKSVNVYISSTRANSSLASVLVGSLPNPPGNLTAFNVAPDPKPNLLPYFEEGAQFTSTATGTQPAQVVNFTGSATVHVYTAL